MRPPRRCIDCGVLFEVASKGNVSSRCPEHRAAYKAERMRRYMRNRGPSRRDDGPQAPPAPRRRRNREIERLVREYNLTRLDPDVQMNCLGREAEFADYDDPPSAEEARSLCAGCPMLKLCDDFATIVERPTWGIRGGKRWMPSPTHPRRGILMPDGYENSQ